MKTRSKILYAASTAQHLRRFHTPYIEALKKNNDVYLMATEGDGIDFPVSFAKSFFSLQNFKSIRKIRSILKTERFDQIIVHTTLAAFLIRAATVGLKKRPRLINVVHGYLFSMPIKGIKSHILLLCEKLMKNRTDALAVMNREDLLIAQKYRLTKGTVSFIKGMGVDFSTEGVKRQEELRERYVSPNGFLCTFVGELSSRKNQIFLIRGIHALRQQGIPASLLLLGEGSEREHLEAEIERLDLKNYVFLEGNREPVLPYLAATDLYISASVSEGLPFNVMEAMSLGLPVLLSDTKGQNDLMGTNGQLLYPLNATDSFCKRVKEVYEKKEWGIGQCEYPALEQYRLQNVFEENIKIFLMEESNEDQA
ncbi:MAG: glycosyltransferase [Clostridia bacterium]|nr:glycosyltransferase [Clostridia bacterium]